MIAKRRMPSWLKITLAVFAVFFVGMGAAMAAFLMPAPPFAQWMAALALALGPTRGLIHAAIAARCLPKPIGARLHCASTLDALLPVVPALLHAYGLLTSIRVQRLRWASIGYKLARSQVESVER